MQTKKVVGISLVNLTKKQEIKYHLYDQGKKLRKVGQDKLDPVECMKIDLFASKMIADKLLYCNKKQVFVNGIEKHVVDIEFLDDNEELEEQQQEIQSQISSQQSRLSKQSEQEQLRLQYQQYLSQSREYEISGQDYLQQYYEKQQCQTQQYQDYEEYNMYQELTEELESQKQQQELQQQEQQLQEDQSQEEQEQQQQQQKQQKGLKQQKKKQKKEKLKKQIEQKDVQQQNVQETQLQDNQVILTYSKKEQEEKIHFIQSERIELNQVNKIYAWEKGYIKDIKFIFLRINDGRYVKMNELKLRDPGIVLEFILQNCILIK